MRSINKTALILVTTLVIPIQAFAQPMVVESRVPGGVAVVELPVSQKMRPEAHYLGSPVMVRQDSGNWFAIIGLGLKTSPGQKLIQLGSDEKKEISFSVENKHYPTQYINGVPKNEVDLSAADIKRYLKEKKIINKAKASWTDSQPETLQLRLPVRSRISGLFGRRRVFNHEPRNPHTGLDLAAPKGTHVFAPADGTVVLTGNFLFIGNAIFIDHGEGLVTLYAHLSKFDVKTGDKVKRGEMIAEVGMTGRATGPHLHWSVYLNHVAVDPLLFINRTTAKELIAGKTVDPEKMKVSSKDYRELINSRS